MQAIDGSDFANSGIHSIGVQGFSHFRNNKDSLLASLNGLVRSFGVGTAVTFRRSCFSWQCLEHLLLEPDSALTELEGLVFEECTNSELIVGPATLENVPGSAVDNAKTVTICVNARSRYLRVIGDFPVVSLGRD
jgi:hypothetical protein